MKNKTSIGNSFLLTGFMIMFFMTEQSFAQWQWAIKAGDTQYDYGDAITTDAAGNIYSTGHFKDPIPSGNVHFGSLTTSGSTANNGYVAKYNSNGSTCNWVTTFYGSHDVEGYSVASEGNFIYAAGLFKGTANFGSFSLVCANTFTAYSDLYVVKLDASTGQVIWAVRDGLGGGQNDKAFQVTAKNGNVYVTGYKGEFYFTSKYNSSGTLLWTADSYTTISAGAGSFARGVKTDAGGNIYTLGHFATLNVPYFFYSAPSSGGPTISLTPIDGDIFLAKYNPNGALQYVKQIGYTSLYDFPAGLSINSSNFIYIAGKIQGNAGTKAYFGGNNNNAYALTCQGVSDMFIAKYNTAGTIQWVTGVGSSGYEEAKAMISDNLGNVYISGYCQFSSASIGCLSFNNNNQYNMFFAKYGSDGNPRWAEQKPYGGENGFSHSIATDNNGGAIVTGFFTNSATFGATTITAYGASDIFLAKISKPAANAGPDQSINGCCGSNQVTIGTPAVGGATYSWTPTGTIIGSSTTAQVLVQPIITTTYDVAMTLGGCTTHDQVTVSVENGPCCRAGESPDDVAGPQLTVYPNPSDGRFTMENESANTINRIEIVDLYGKIIYNIDVLGAGERHEVNIPSLSKGCYFCNVYDLNGNRETKKVIIF